MKNIKIHFVSFVFDHYTGEKYFIVVLDFIFIIFNPSKTLNFYKLRLFVYT